MNIGLALEVLGSYGLAVGEFAAPPWRSEITLGPQCAKLVTNWTRWAGSSSIGKMPAMKYTKAYSRARTHSRLADWASRSLGMAVLARPLG